MAMLLDPFRLWYFEPPPVRVRRLARRFVKTGLEKFHASSLLRVGKNQSIDDWYAGADLLDVVQIEFLCALVSCSSRSQEDSDLLLKIEKTLTSSIEIEGVPPSGGNYYLWSQIIDAQALRLGIPFLSLSPRLAPQPRAALCW